MIPALRTLARSTLAIALLLTVGPRSEAKIVDNFNGATKTGWTDFSFGIGGNTQTGGQLKFSIPPFSQAIFAATTKTTETFTVADGKTVELRVDLVSGNSQDSFAVLAWTPSGGNISSLQGYSIAKSSNEILISKGINKYFVDEEDAVPAIKNDNVTLVLILTGSGSNVIITGRVLDKDANNKVIWEKTFIDTPAAEILVDDGTDDPAAPWTGDGRLTLMEFEDPHAGGPSAYEVIFDNAEGFQLENAVVDNFDDNTKTAWTDFSFGLGSVVETGGQFKLSLPNINDVIFLASSKTARSYEFKDGEKLEFRVDVVSANNNNSFAVLAWLPDTQLVSDLSGYGFTKAPDEVLISKGINKYFFDQDIVLKNSNVTLALTLERRGSDVVGNGRIYDKDANNAVIFDQNFIDTAAADVLVEGEDSPVAAPFDGPGKFVLLLVEDGDAVSGPATYDVIFDNAWASFPPAPANTAPSIGDISPENFRNFIAPTNTISFKVTDDKPVPAGGVAVILNGVRYANTNGLTLNASGNTTTAALGGLVANKNYTAVLESTDSDNVVTRSTLYFDTFATNSFLIEAEDYNFGGGLFIDNPDIIQLGGDGGNGYRYQEGLSLTDAIVDYFSTRTGYSSPYRPDRVTLVPSFDFERAAYLALGGKANGYVDYDVSRIRAGEWQRYTRTFPAGTFEVYLRESYFNVPTGETVLEQVNGEANDPAAPVSVLGSFIGSNSGALYKNIPLTDASGQSVATVTFDGVTTLRLRNVTPEPGDGTIAQNYLIFIPTTAVINRPRVASLSPVPRSTVNTAQPRITATLQDRDTTVNTNTVELFVAGSKVSAAISSPSAGSTLVDYVINALPASGTTLDASIRFTDSSGVRVTNDWTFTVVYASVNAANRAGVGINRGFNVRVVQAALGQNLANTVTRAEDQLAAGTSILKAYDTNVFSDVINFNQDQNSAGRFANDILIPGLDSEEAVGTEDIAMEATAYLELPQGIVRFGVTSDDGFKVSAGAGLHDLTPILDFHNGGPADDQAFDVLVPAAGMYPVRLIWYERSGGAHVEFYTIDRVTTVRTLVNDPNTQTAIKAFRDVAAVTELVTVYSSGNAAGNFTLDANATVDTGAKTITAQTSGAARFYLIHSTAPGAVKIKSVAVQGASVQMTYGAP